MSEFKRGTPNASIRAGDDEVRPVTAVFADVVGSTALGERLSPSEVKALIGECVSRMCEAIEGFGGCVRSYMGDGVAGFFGIDQAREDDSERAVRAALEIRRVSEEYAHEVESAWGISNFGVRIGVNAGRVAVGSVGAGNPQRVALGDAVNVAARLQSAARPGTIVVGPSIPAAVGHRFVFRALGPLSIRGRQSQADAFELEAEDAFRATDARARLIGRDAPLAELSDALAELREGRGQLVALTGESGIGKSRLLAELQRKAPPDVLWLEAFCDSMDERLPHEPFAQMLRGWLGIEGRSSPIESRLRLRARAKELLGDQFEECGPYLARLLGVGLTTKLDHRLDGLPGEVLASGLESAVALWLTALGTNAPLVLAIDNFGAASQSTVDLVRGLLPTLETAPVMLLVTMRSSIKSPAQALHALALTALDSRVRTIRLGPLTTDESRELVGELGGREHIEPRLAGLVVERAEGNPLYIEELLASVEDSTSEQRASTTLPRPLEGVLLARLDALEPSVRRAVQAAAVLGRTFMHDVVALMVGDEAAKQAIPSLLRADLIRERSRVPRAYVFRHGLIREAALSTLPPGRFLELNELAASALERWTAFDLERDTPALASHFLACGRFSDALKHVDRLADRLAQVCRWRDAANLLAGCIDEVQGAEDVPCEVRVRLAHLWSTQGRVDDAIATLDEGLPLASQLEGEELVLAKAQCLNDAGRIEEAAQVLTCSDELVVSSTARARLDILRGELALARSDYAVAKECVARVGDIHALPRSLAFHGASLKAGVLASAGALTEAESWALYAQELADRSGQLEWQLSSRRHVAVICLWKGCVEEAHHLFRSLHEQCAGLGWVTGTLYAALSLMHVCCMRGELEEGARIGEDVLLSNVEGQWRAMISANLAAIRAEQGRFEDAIELVEDVCRVDDELPIWAKMSARTVRAAAARARNELHEAQREMMAGLEMTKGEGFETEHSMMMGLLAEVFLSAGDYASALALSERAMGSASSMEPWWKLVTERQYGHSLTRKNRGTATHLLRRALDSARDMGLVLEEGRILTSLGDVDADRREEYFSLAQRLFEERGATYGLVQLQAIRSRLRSSAPV